MEFTLFGYGSHTDHVTWMILKFFVVFTPGGSI